MIEKPAALFILNHPACDDIYGYDLLGKISARVRLLAPPLEASQLEAIRPLLSEVELLFTGWGTVPLEASILEMMPRLKMVFYSGGSIRSFATTAMWRRGIRVTTAAGVNAEVVADYVVGATLFALKQGFGFARCLKETRSYDWHQLRVPGVRSGTVALISFGLIAQAVARTLRPIGPRVLAYDPFLSAADAEEAGVERVSLEEAFAKADVVSVHTPLLPATIGLIVRPFLSSLRPGATFINTARGAIVRSHDLFEVLRARPDLTAILDVTDPDPPEKDSPYFTLPNILLTPHSAGAVQGERRLLGRFMLAELDRWLNGNPLEGEITEKRAVLLA